MNNKCKAAFRVAKCLCTCHASPMPMNEVDMEDVPDLTPDLDDKDDKDDEPYVGGDALEDKDCIFVAMIPCEVEFICATSNISQWLAEVFRKNSELKLFHESMPSHFHDFEDLFAKSSFDHTYLIARSGTMPSNWSLGLRHQAARSTLWPPMNSWRWTSSFTKIFEVDEYTH
jgi:hypothetical protein